MNGAQAPTRTIALRCPACGSGLALPAGSTIEHCPACPTARLLDVPGHVPRLSAVRRLDARHAWQAVRRWLREELPWPLRHARLVDAHLVYAPFWLLQGRAVGFSTGERRDAFDVQVSCAQPAYDLSELPVGDIRLAGDELVPLDRAALLRDGMLLKESVPQGEGMRRGVETLRRAAQAIAHRPQERFRLIGRQQALLAYPLWLIRFRYWGEHYRAVVDGTAPRVLEGQVSDRVPKLLLMLAALAALGSAFGFWGVLIAGVLAAIFGPRPPSASPRPERSHATPVQSPPAPGEEEEAPAEGGWLTALRCPTCGRALPAERDAVLFACTHCHQGVEYRRGALRPLEVAFVEAQAGGAIPHPWWALRVRARERRLPGPDRDTIEIYVPAYALPFSECLAQGAALTRRQPRLRRVEGRGWPVCTRTCTWTCTVSRDDAMRLAELIYLSLDEAHAGRQGGLELVSSQLVVFLSGCDASFSRL